MNYSYEKEREGLFTESGQRFFLEIRDQVRRKINESGALRFDKISFTGDTWKAMACLDRMVELGEIVKLRAEGTCWGQYQVYTTPETNGR